jgi:hypothetical protein
MFLSGISSVLSLSYLENAQAEWEAVHSMTNIAKVLNVEIAKISRENIKAAIGEHAKSPTGLRRSIVGWKKRVDLLEREGQDG